MQSLDWLQIGVMVATALGTLGVFIQARIAARQADLQEIESARQERSAWSALDKDWKRTQIVAGGPQRGASVDPELASAYDLRLRAYQQAHLAAWASEEHPDPTDEASGMLESHFDQAIDADIAAYSALSIERASVARVLSHLFQVATFYFERKVSISAIYSAAGPDLVQGAWAVDTVSKFAPDYMDGCVAGVYEEARYWRTLDLDDLSARLGWASAVGASLSSLGRLDALMAALTIYAHKLGDLHEIRVDAVSVEEVGNPKNLARIWKSVRPMSWRLASALCFQAAYYRDQAERHHRRWRRARAASSAVALWHLWRARSAARTLSPLHRWLPSVHELQPEEELH